MMGLSEGQNSSLGKLLICKSVFFFIETIENNMKNQFKPEIRETKVPESNKTVKMSLNNSIT